MELERTRRLSEALSLTETAINCLDAASETIIAAHLDLVVALLRRELGREGDPTPSAGVVDPIRM